jgi:hypothetical protein
MGTDELMSAPAQAQATWKRAGGKAVRWPGIHDNWTNQHWAAMTAGQQPWECSRSFCAALTQRAGSATYHLTRRLCAPEECHHNHVQVALNRMGIQAKDPEELIRSADAYAVEVKPGTFAGGLVTVSQTCLQDCSDQLVTRCREDSQAVGIAWHAYPAGAHLAGNPCRPKFPLPSSLPPLI